MSEQSEMVMCQVTGALFPINELVTANIIDYSNALGRDNRAKLFIHPSVVDNSRLSRYVTTLTGAIWHDSWVYSTRDNSQHLAQDDSRLATDYGYVICPDCNVLEHEDDMVYLGDNFDRSVCSSCVENYDTCPECGDYITSNDDASCHCGYGPADIHDYSYKPEPNFQGTQTDKNPFIGFELEVETKRGSQRDQASCVKEHYTERDLFLKTDGSLNNGFEIVSHPMTLDIHKRKGYKPLFEELSRLGCRSHNTSTCGLHFHMDKSNMKQTHQVRFSAFFALAKHKLEVLARRTSEDYAAFKHKSTSLTDMISARNRYQAVNWTNPHTVEVRIFRGTLRYETFMANMELCHAIYAFTYDRNSMNCEYSENAVWDRFRKYVSKNKTKYPFLLQHLDERKELIAKAIKKDADILKLEKERIKKTKKLKLTDNVIEATLEQERKPRRINGYVTEPESFIYLSDSDAAASHDVMNNYRYLIGRENAVGIALNDTDDHIDY